MTKITVFLIFLIVLVVGYYSYLSGKSRTEQQEAIMSEVDTALSRDLTNNYPATPKEVIRYYNKKRSSNILERLFYFLPDG